MGKNKRGKIPTAATSRDGGKRDIPIQEQESSNDKKPSWKFGRFDAECVDWGMATMKANLETVLNGLKSYEEFTWHQIKTMTHDRGKTKNHSVDIDGLTPAAKARLNQIKIDDIEEVFSLRFTNLFRVIGIRDGAVLYILWIDPDHKVCKTSH